MNSLHKVSNVLIIAAEESSTLYAQHILENWKKRGLNVRAYGIGNEAMAKIGFDRVIDSTEVAVVGVGEIWRHWDKIKLAFRGIVARAKEQRPDFALLLDYPGFNLRMAKELKKMGIPVIYYISPQLWAWKKSRVEKVKKYCDRMLVLFPFEKEFYEKHNFNADYVGHPLLDLIDEQLLDGKSQQFERQRFGIQNHEKLIGIMPGSRRSEIKFNLSTQLETLRLLHLEKPDVKFALLLAPNLSRSDIDLPVSDFSIQIIQKPPFEMIRLCDVILCASGTATLMVGLMEKPMVIMYKMNPLSAWLARRLVKINYFGLVNIISNNEIVPERFQEEATPPVLAKLLMDFLDNKELQARTVTSLRTMKSRLGAGGATENVIRILDNYIK